MGKVKILLVDDSGLVLRHVATLLRTKGWHVDTAESVAIALQKYSRSQPDVLLTDFILDNAQTGLMLISAIFAGSFSKKAAVAILTVGQLTMQDQEKATSLGVQVIQKPAKGKEEEFLQNVEFWMHDLKVIK